MKIIFIYSLFIFQLLTAPLSVSAVECEQTSPTYKEGEHPFVPVEVILLDSQMTSNLASLYKKISGDWQGQGTEVDCIFEEGTPVKRERPLQLEAIIETDYSLTARVNTSANNIQSNVIDSHVFSLYLVDGFLRQDSLDLQGDVEILELANNVLEYRYIWQSFGQRGSFTNEDFIRIEYSNVGLVISKIHYTQGYFGYSYTWNLR